MRLVRRPGNFSLLVALLVSAAGAGTSIGIANVVRHKEAQRLRARFDRVSADAIERLDESFRTNLGFAETTRSLYRSSQDVTREEFGGFVADVLGDRTSIVAMEWIPVVPASRRRAFESRVRREGLPGFVIKDSDGQAARARDTCYPLLYSEPFARDDVALGFDYGAIPAFREAMLDAQRLGHARATRDHPLHFAGGRDSTDIRVFIPVCVTSRIRGADPSHSCRGFVCAVFGTRDLMERALGGLELADVDLSVYEEDGAGAEQLIYTRWSRARLEADPDAGGPTTGEGAAFDGRGFAASQRLNLAGLPWRIVATPTPAFFTLNDEQNWRLVLLAGLALSVGGGYAVLNAVRLLLSREERTRLHLAAIVESSADAIYTKSLGGKITSWNRSAERLFGYSAPEVIGQPISMILPDAGLQETSTVVEPDDRETRTRQYETVRVAKDGRKIDVSLSVSPIRNARGEMTEAAVIARDITDRKHAERMKDDFIHLASHQLRTPLSALRLYTDMLLDGYAGELTTEQRDYLNIVATSTLRMIDLVGTLLNISRIESRALMINPAPHNLGELLIDVLNELEVDVNAKRIALEAQIGSGHPLVPVDPTILHEIYINLLSNAVKYTPERGAIQVDLELQEDWFVTTIRDTGHGIPQEDHDHVFTRFYRADNVKNEQEGSGLGLYLVKSLCDLSGCHISFTSEAGNGTTFRFSVPRAGMKEKKGRSQLEPGPRKERLEHV
jgi:PAS domain S-box-containing protein